MLRYMTFSFSQSPKATFFHRVMLPNTCVDPHANLEKALKHHAAKEGRIRRSFHICSAIIGERERANLVVQQARFFYIILYINFIYLYISMSPALHIP